MGFHVFTLCGEPLCAYKELTNPKSDYKQVLKKVAVGVDSLKDPGCVDKLHPFALALIYKFHVKHRRPFYRMWPGFVENIAKMNMPTNFPQFYLGVDSLEIDFMDSPEMSLLLDTGMGVIQCISMQQMWTSPNQAGDLFWILAIQYLEYGSNAVKYLTVLLNNKIVPEMPEMLAKIIYSLYLVKNNPDIVQPKVLAKDLEKYKATGDEKYVLKARRNGFIGYDVGKELPTKSEIKQMRKENSEALSHGQKCPHIRSSHLHLFWTGTERSIPVIKLVKETFVNVAKLREIPQGYYGENK